MVINRIDFDSSSDLVYEIKVLHEDIDNNYPLISVYGKYGVIKELLEDLIAYGGFPIADEIKLECCDVSHYDKEFVLYVGENGINVEKTFVDGKYYYGGGNISFIHEKCSSILLKYIDSDKIYEFRYSDKEHTDEENDECNGNGKCCCDCKGKETNNKPISTTSKETFTVNGKRVDKDTYKKELAKFEDRYLDNIRDMLLRYADFMDDWNELLKLLY